MGKDREGNFHPKKGEPSGANKEEGLGFEKTPPEELNEYNEITDEYTKGPDELADGVNLRHANRNTSKGESSFKQTNPNPERDRTLKEKNEEPEAEATQIEELPGILTKTLFKEIGTYEAPYCVSIFLDSHSSGMEVNERYDPINFKNALQKADEVLSKRGVDIIQIEKMLQPGYKLLKDEKLWLNMMPGFAVFIAEGYFKYIKLPVRPGNHFVVEESFYVTPLLPALMNSDYFYVLSISKKQCKFYKGNPFGIEEMEIEGMPDGIMEEISDRGVSTTFRTGSGEGAGEGAYHGLSDGTKDDKVYLRHYLQLADEAIWKQVLARQTAPLVLVGVDYVISTFRQISQYQNIWDATITGNYDHKNEQELFPMVMEVIHPYFETDVKKALEEFGNYMAQGQASTKIDEVVSASYYGRVSQLFVQKNHHIWGRFDEMNDKVTHLQEDDEGAQDLIDNAVVKTLLMGGDVFTLEENEMPNNSQLAAIFRY